MTYGTARYNPPNKSWLIDCEPHIAILLKRMFPVMAEQRTKPFSVAHTEDVAQTLQWFQLRYPLKMGTGDRWLLDQAAAAAKMREEQSFEIVAGRSQMPPIALALPLRSYQQIAVDLVRNNEALLCADDLGLGKTAVGIGSVADMHPAVVVCQTHLQLQWYGQIKRFAPKLRVRIAKTGKTESLHDVDVLIITYTKLVGWQYLLSMWAQNIVFDEFQELRHDDSDKFKAATTIVAKMKRRLGLTATPVYNYGGEIWNLLNLLKPDCLGQKAEFAKEWCKWSSAEGKMIVCDPPALGAFLRSQNLMIRRTRKDVGRELKPLTKFAHQVEYDPKVLESIRSEMLQLAEVILKQGGTFTEKGRASQQMSLKLRQATGIAKAPFVADFAIEMARSGKKILVTGWHREVYDVLMEKFTKAGVPFWLYTGSESPAAKKKSADEFCDQEGGGVFIISLRSGAGLDGLQAVCDTILHGELDWSPQVHSQCDGRLHRDGQAEDSNGVTVIYLLADAGSDPIIAQLLGVKMQQGHGITDPTIDLENVAKAEVIDTQAEADRIKTLAREFVKRYKDRAVA